MSAEQLTLHPTALCTASWPIDPADDFFGAPFIDIDESRETPVRHRYVHGGFRGSDSLFSFYFPDPAAYEGRFFQHVTPVPQSENLGPLLPGVHNKVAFAARNGAYFVETNGGGPAAADPFSGMDPTIGAYRMNAAAARFSRVVAEALYGPGRAYGYLYGGSGGAYRTIGASENTDGVWDGFVPYVPGSPMSIPSVFSVRMHAQRILRDRFPEIVDAYDTGGDPASLDLTEEEAAALAEVTGMGFPPRSWFGWKTMGMHAFSVLYSGVMAADPTYAEDFWNLDGYLGADAAASVHRDRVQLATAVAELIAEPEAADAQLAAGGVDESFLHAPSAGLVAAAVRLADTPAGWMLGAQLHIVSGDAIGSVLRLLAVDGDVARLEPGQEAIAARLAVGDEVVLDNSGFLAAQTYHRHQVPGPEYAVWDQFRGEGGAPLYPQRPILLGPLFTQGAAGTLPTGDITGKMIAVACLLDREAFPWQADWYRARVHEHLGDAAEDRFRLWFIDNALHGDDEPQEFPTRSVSYLGALEAALRQLAAWVERGVSPSPTTSYEVIDGQVVLTDAVSRHGGVQPFVRIVVNGEESAAVRAGESVTIRIEAATDGGAITEIVADLTGAEAFDTQYELEPGSRRQVESGRAFSEPGVHLLTARATAVVGDAADGAAPRVHNLARARVTVTT